MEKLQTGVNVQTKCGALVVLAKQKAVICLWRSHGSPTAREAFLVKGQSSGLLGCTETFILWLITVPLGDSSFLKGKVGLPALSGQSELPLCLLLPREAAARCTGRGRGVMARAAAFSGLLLASFDSFHYFGRAREDRLGNPRKTSKRLWEKELNGHTKSFVLVNQSQQGKHTRERWSGDSGRDGSRLSHSLWTARCPGSPRHIKVSFGAPWHGPTFTPGLVCSGVFTWTLRSRGSWEECGKVGTDKSCIRHAEFCSKSKTENLFVGRG